VASWQEGCAALQGWGNPAPWRAGQIAAGSPPPR
jgi:hypothetical protein